MVFALVRLGIDLATVPVINDVTLGSTYFLRFTLLMACIALLWFGVLWAAAGGLAAATGVYLTFGLISVDQTIFVMLLCAISAAYSPPLVRRSYAVLAGAWGLHMAYIAGEIDTQAVLLTTYCLVLAGLYAIGHAARQARRRHLHARTMAAQESRKAAEERRLLAQEIHDGIAQDMTLIAMHTEALKDQSADTSERKQLDQIHGRAVQGLRRLQRVVALLHNDERAEPDHSSRHVDLSRGLETLSEDLRLSGIPTTLEFGGNTAHLSPELETECFTILKEAVVNVLKYGSRQADDPRSFCHIRVIVEPTHVDIDITNSVAPDTDPSLTGTGLGFKAARRRTEAHGGTFTAEPCGDSVWRMKALNIKTADIVSP